MIGNVLPEYLSFSDHPFPPRSSTTQPFPTLAETHAYLRCFAKPFMAQGKIRLNTQVVRVDELEDGGWLVVMKDWNAAGKGREIEECWDAVVVATGWYDNPVWPRSEGLNEVRTKGLAIHAKEYRGPAGYGGKVWHSAVLELICVFSLLLSACGRCGKWEFLQRHRSAAGRSGSKTRLPIYPSPSSLPLRVSSRPQHHRCCPYHPLHHARYAPRREGNLPPPRRIRNTQHRYHFLWDGLRSPLPLPSRPRSLPHPWRFGTKTRPPDLPHDAALPHTWALPPHTVRPQPNARFRGDAGMLDALAHVGPMQHVSRARVVGFAAVS
jgi:hypothetical protein